MRIAGSAFAIVMLLRASALGQVAPPSQSRIPLREEAKTEGLPLLIATNQFGLAAEAQSLVPWIRSHPGSLTLRPDTLLLEDTRAATIKVSP
ncbi:MAG TPA: hypothetical protein PLD86_20235, partial [Vicinamibacteria bacterium]|nr:hypothetical protein [Vicinamibacteria bacterium]